MDLFNNYSDITIGETLVCLCCSLILFSLLIHSQFESIEFYTTWITRIIFFIAFIFEYRYLYSRQIISFINRKSITIILFVFFIATIIFFTFPILFIYSIGIPFVFIFIHFYFKNSRNDRKSQAIDPSINIRSIMILFDCFSFLKISTTISLITYHLLTQSSLPLNEILTKTICASSDSLFPYGSNGNNQWMLIMYCSLAIIIWQYNIILYIPTAISWIYLSYRQYTYYIHHNITIISLIIPTIYPLLVFSILFILKYKHYNSLLPF